MVPVTEGRVTIMDRGDVRWCCNPGTKVARVFQVIRGILGPGFLVDEGGALFAPGGTVDMPSGTYSWRPGAYTGESSCNCFSASALLTTVIPYFLHLYLLP